MRYAFIAKRCSLRGSVPCSGFRLCRPHLRAFSLVEMMIAIVILGLGLVMVATMFPVAWDRARTLSEYTVEQSAAAGAQATLEKLLRPAGYRLERIVAPVPTIPPFEELRLTSGSLAGDLFFDPTLPGILPADEGYLAILAFSDTSVHSLNLANFLLKTGAPQAENPWDLEDPTDIVQKRFIARDKYPYAAFPRNRGLPFPDQLYYGGEGSDELKQPQVRTWQRLYPPMEAQPTAPGPELDQWHEKLATRRFCWAVLHRLRSQIGPKPLALGVTVSLAESERLVREAAAAMGSTRTFDVYYVTLRRARPTNRYARQDPDPAKIPNPFVFDPDADLVEPAAMPSDADVLFPVAWRVQMKFPERPQYRDEILKPIPDPTRLPTGIPTEIQFPENQITGEAARMLVQMFPAGTQFIDEITGNIYRVAKRRIVDDKGERVVLTLNREVVLEDIDIPLPDSRCQFCTPIDPLDPKPDTAELLRTVWVFPPPVDRSQSSNEQTPQFDGPSPVVDIEVSSLSISPSS